MRLPWHRRAVAPLPLDCRELVDLVTEYLEGTLDAEQRARFEEHITDCSGCASHLHQMRVTIELLGRIPEESLSTTTVQTLGDAFAGWVTASAAGAPAPKGDN